MGVQIAASLFVSTVLTLAANAADLSAERIQENLAIANEYVLKQKARAQQDAFAASALSEGVDPNHRPNHRPDRKAYAVGQTWWVASELSAPTIARKTSESSRSETAHDADLKFYQFQVVALDEKNVKVEVCSKGQSKPCTLIAIDRDKNSAAIESFSGAAGLSLFPFVVPGSGESQEVTPKLAPGISALGDKIVAMNSSERRQYSAEDLYSRKIEVLWQKGEPWPAYMRGPSGVAVLLKEAP